MNDKQTAIKEFRDSLESEYRLADSIMKLRDQIEECRRLWHERSKLTDSYKSVLLNEYEMDASQVEVIGKEAIQAVAKV